MPDAKQCPCLPLLQRGEVRLQRRARRVLRARVLVALVPPELGLHVGRGLVDRDRDGAGVRLRLLAGVDAIGGKTHDQDSLRQRE